MKRKSEIRRMLEQDVIAFNKTLHRAARKMPVVLLLRNCHPLYRQDYSQKLLKMGVITEREAIEFKE